MDGRSIYLATVLDRHNTNKMRTHTHTQSTRIRNIGGRIAPPFGLWAQTDPVHSPSFDREMKPMTEEAICPSTT